jgi:hypothetical protein
MIIQTFNLIAICSLPPFDGITLYSANNGPDSNRTILINNDGDLLNEWIGADRIASTAYLLPGGELLRPCKATGPNGPASGGRIQKFSYEGEVLWDYTWGDENNQPHHDICSMPNGNVLIVAWDKKTQAEGTAAGRQNLNSQIWPTQIVEVMPTGLNSGEVVWEWHLWDHIIQDISPSIPNYGAIHEHPEKIDINKGNIAGGGAAGDWIHVNALDYHPVLDQIVFSSNSLDEIYIIDHSITTEEAAGPAGDILYRWGNPSNYERKGQHVLWNVHGVNWIDEGLPGENNLILFNNGNDDNSSDLIEFLPPLLKDGTYEIEDDQPFDPLPGDYVFFYESNDFHGDHLCGVYRLANGNTIATNGPGQEVRELNSEGEIVWQHFTPFTLMRAVKYSYDILDPPVGTCLGDTNDDSVVNVSDLLLVIDQWGAGSGSGDVNDDGLVNVNDVLMIVGNWGPCE